MALTSVASGFGIASTIGTYVGVAQNHLNKNNNQLCQITASLSNTTANVLLALEGLSSFANILTEDECGFIKGLCKSITDKLEKYQNTPIPKKKKFFRETREYKDHFEGVKKLETKSSKLLVQFRQVSSDAVIRNAQVKRVEQQDREAREARRNFLEDIRYRTTMKQLDLSGVVNLSAIKMPMEQEIQSTNEDGMTQGQNPFSDEVSAAWAEHKALQDHA